MANLTKINPSSDQNVLLTFDTGEEFIVPNVEFRFQCPCATCVDELTGERTLKREAVREDVKPKSIEPVGRYGIKVNWSDGHSTGMYHFDTLYALAKKSRD